MVATPPFEGGYPGSSPGPAADFFLGIPRSKNHAEISTISALIPKDDEGLQLVSARDFLR